MSSQRGNALRSRPQKHKNKSAFRNNMHTTNKRVLAINAIEVSGCCIRCTEVINWKIQFKKYKPLTVPKKCVRCLQPRKVKDAYHIVCGQCAEEKGVCAKCAKPIDNISKIEESIARGTNNDTQRIESSNNSHQTMQTAAKQSSLSDKQEEQDLVNSRGVQFDFSDRILGQSDCSSGDEADEDPST